MKYAYLLIAIPWLAACGGRAINANLARDGIIGISEEALKKEDVDVENVSEFGGSEAIAETRLKTAFRLERVQGKWIVREVRLGHGQWEKVGNLEQALEMVRIEETHKLLEQVSEAIRRYEESNSRLPEFKDYVSLSDLLSPMYMTPLIRLDGWRRPLAAERLDANTILLLSAGPDGKFGTSDDIRQTVSR